MPLKDKYSIVGAATTRFGKLPGSTHIGFNVEAAKLAIEDAGIDKKEIDCVLTKFPRIGFIDLYAHQIAQHLGIQPKVCAEIDNARATNATIVQYETAEKVLINSLNRLFPRDFRSWGNTSNLSKKCPEPLFRHSQYAMMCIDAGLCKTALCVYGDNPFTGIQGTYGRGKGSDVAYGLPSVSFNYTLIAYRRTHWRIWYFRGTPTRALVSRVKNKTDHRSPLRGVAKLHLQRATKE